MEKTIFFDFFGVISSEVAPFWFKRYFDDDKAAIIKEKICSKSDNGDITEQETFQEISSITGVDPDIIRSEWLDLVHINTELVEKILELKKTYKIYLLSNASTTFLGYVLDKYNLNRLFDKEFISAAFHKIKPHTDYFQYVLDDLNLDGKNCIMIDDNPLNIEGAKSAGINGIIYKDNTDLFIKLNNFLRS